MKGEWREGGGGREGRERKRGKGGRVISPFSILLLRMVDVCGKGYDSPSMYLSLFRREGEGKGRRRGGGWKKEGVEGERKRKKLYLPFYPAIKACKGKRVTHSLSLFVHYDTFFLRRV